MRNIYMVNIRLLFTLLDRYGSQLWFISELWKHTDLLCSKQPMADEGKVRFGQEAKTRRITSQQDEIKHEWKMFGGEVGAVSRSISQLPVTDNVGCAWIGFGELPGIQRGVIEQRRVLSAMKRRRPGYSWMTKTPPSEPVHAAAVCRSCFVMLKESPCEQF